MQLKWFCKWKMCSGHGCVYTLLLVVVAYTHPWLGPYSPLALNTLWRWVERTPGGHGVVWEGCRLHVRDWWRLLWHLHKKKKKKIHLWMVFVLILIPFGIFPDILFSVDKFINNLSHLIRPAESVIFCPVNHSLWCIHIEWQECIPVGCVPPACV